MALLSVSPKIRQLIVPRLNGVQIDDPKYRSEILRLACGGIGGFIVFGGERESIKAFIEELKKSSTIPLFIASDVERGVGQQIEGATLFPSQMSVASAIDMNDEADMKLLDEMLIAISSEARDIGINMPLVPVMDVNLNPENPIICTRAFSDDIETVIRFGVRYIKRLETDGLITSAKHFPGHGDTSIDSHISLPVIEKAYDKLVSEDLRPFVSAINAGAGSIMVGHLKVPSIDARPATLSHDVISGLLKGKLGYKGLVMTDALNMSALAEYGNPAVECLKAGADILLHPVDVDETGKEITVALDSGELATETIDKAYERILQVKQNLHIVKPNTVDYESNRQLADEIFMKSICMVKGDDDLKIDHERCHVIVSGDDTKVFDSRFKKVSTLEETNRIEEETAIFAVFTNVSAWHGTSGISDETRDKILKLAGSAKRSIVVSFGSPYVLSLFGNASALIAVCDRSEPAQRAFVRAVIEGHTPSGRLSVKIIL